jgi:tetratricopeptide (TPR) repeat protein
MRPLSIRTALAAAMVLAGEVGAGVDVNNYSFLAGDEGARALAMGGAGYCLAEGSEGFLVSPAALTATAFPQVLLDVGMYAGHQGTNLAFAGWGFGGNIRYYKLNRELKEAYPPYAAFGEEGALFSVGYGRRLGERLAVAGALNLLTFYLGEHTAGAAALDAGVFYDLTATLTAGAGVKHLGGDLSWQPEDLQRGYPAPRDVPGAAVAGVGFRPWGGRMAVAADLYFPLYLNEIAGRRGDALYGRAGIEYWVWRWLAVRGGYRSGLEEVGTYISLGVAVRFGDFDVAFAGAPSSDAGEYLSYEGNVESVSGEAYAVGVAYSFGRSRAAGVAETEERLGAEFEAQRELMVTRLLSQGEKFYAQRRYEDAVETFNIIMIWDPDHERAAELLALAETGLTAERLSRHLSQAREFLAQGSYADALVEVKQALALDPANAEAEALQVEAESRLALETGEVAADVVSLLEEAQEHYERGNYSAAIASWSAVLARDPGNRLAATSIADAQLRMAAEEQEHWEMAEAAETAGRTFEALRHYEAAARANPANAEVRAALERLRQAHTARAEELAAAAAGALANRDYGQAESLAREALAYQPANARANTVLAGVAREREPAPSRSEARRNYPDLYKKGIEAYMAHNYPAAIAYWEQIPSDDPLYSKAAQNIERARAVLKKLEE